MKTRTGRDEDRTEEISSLVLRIPNDFRELEAKFQLARYSLPSGWEFESIHAALHQQLTKAYRVWMYATPPSVYVLWPLNEQVGQLRFGDEIAEPQLLRFSEIPFHLAVKLLMEDYFRGESQFFTGQGKHYRFVKWAKDKQSVTCLEFDMSAAEGVGIADPIQTFNVQAGARRFVCYPPDRAQPGRYSYYGRTLGRDGGFNVQLLTQEEAAARVKKGESVWGFPKGSERRARLEFFREQSVETTRGYVLWEFCHQFALRLVEVGIPAELKKRSFTHYSASKPKKGSSLDLDMSGTAFYVLDVRHFHKVPLEYYLGQFRAWFPGSVFTSVSESNIATITDGPIIVLMDATENAYDGALANTGYEDPYKPLYEKYAEVPLQGFTVNQNPDDADSMGPDSYFDYSYWEGKRQLEDFQRRADLTVRDALLKHVILRGIPLEGILPDTPALGSYLYVLRQNHNGVRYTVFMQVQDGRVQLNYAMDAESRTLLYSACEGYGLSWDDVEDSIVKRRAELKLDQREFDFLAVIGSSCASEIVDLPEYALHRFDEIQRRVEEREAPKPIEFFLTLPHYDSYAATRHWPLLSEITRDRNDRMLTKSQQEAYALTELLRRHDEYLYDLSKRVPMISAQSLRKLDDYTSMLNVVGLTHTMVSLVLNAGGKLLNPRKDDVVFHSGIWFDASDQTYMVGSPDGIQPKQANALHLRRSEKRIGEGVSLEDMLQLMAVGFVRLNQYTVLPFPFKLLRLYIENYLSWKLKSPTNS